MESISDSVPRKCMFPQFVVTNLTFYAQIREPESGEGGRGGEREIRTLLTVERVKQRHFKQLKSFKFLNALSFEFSVKHLTFLVFLERH